MKHMPGPAAAMVLTYLCDHVFHTEDNPEGAAVGTVLFAASRQSAIADGSAIRSRTTVREALNWLQEHAYIVRYERPGGETIRNRNAPQPHKIGVLFQPQFEALRESARAGNPVVEITMHRPRARRRAEPEVAPVTHLRLVQ